MEEMDGEDGDEKEEEEEKKTFLRTNVSATIRHRTGRERSFDHCHKITETDDGEILAVEFFSPHVGEMLSETYDARSWGVVSVDIEQSNIPEAITLLAELKDSFDTGSDDYGNVAMVMAYLESPDYYGTDLPAPDSDLVKQLLNTPAFR